MERKVDVTYYGLIAEKLGKNSEELLLPTGDIELKKFIEITHPELSGLTFSIAVDLEITTTIPENVLPNKIDVMPPFAGG